MRADNDLLRTTEEQQRNTARLQAWRHRYELATGRTPNGDITAHRHTTRGRAH